MLSLERKGTQENQRSFCMQEEKERRSHLFFFTREDCVQTNEFFFGCVCQDEKQVSLKCCCVLENGKNKRVTRLILVTGTTTERRKRTEATSEKESGKKTKTCIIRPLFSSMYQ